MASPLLLPGMPGRAATGDDGAAAHYRRWSRAREDLFDGRHFDGDTEAGRASADLACIERAAAALLAAALDQHDRHAQLAALTAPEHTADAGPSWPDLTRPDTEPPPPRLDLVDSLTTAPTAPPATAGVHA